MGDVSGATGTCYVPPTMRTGHALLKVAFVVAVVLGGAGCLPPTPVVVPYAHLGCDETPGDLCIRIVEAGLAGFPEWSDRPRRLLAADVNAAECSEVMPTARRCWRIAGGWIGSEGFRARVYELGDGSLHRGG